jgi:hypothetical protein
MAGLAGACRDNPAGPPSDATLTLATSGDPGVVRTAVAPVPTFVLRDAAGRPLGGFPVSIAVDAGGGTLRDAPRNTGAGPTPVGEWILGASAGHNALVVRIGALPPLRIEVTGLPDLPADMTPEFGADQTAFAGDNLPQSLAAKVFDRFGNGVPGVVVTFAVESGDGSLSESTLTTDGNGIAGGLTWQLGGNGGNQVVTATTSGLMTTFTATIRSSFDPVVRFIGPAPSPTIAAAFDYAVQRVHAAITGDIPDVAVQGFDLSRCGISAPSITEVVDDMVIYAVVAPIDGIGGIVGSAGPCLQRTMSGYTVIGVMRFDEADLDALALTRRLNAVVLHEMLHLVGVGILWNTVGLLAGSGTGDPRFLGNLATERCVRLGGAEPCGIGTVPAENIGGPGTVDLHWRESVFHSELMTSFLEPTPNMPLSEMTLASLADIGLTPNYHAADPYVVPASSPGIAPRLPGVPDAPWETIQPPRFEITPEGWVRPIRSR